jgi:hypothetical protein
LASSVDIIPSLGQGLSFLQEGPGVSPGYGAIDRRRMLTAAGVREGIVHENAYKVSAAGTGLTVSVAADQGLVNIQGDSVAQQGVYTVAPHNSAITLDIAAGHATLPRNDLVVLEALDDDHDSGGLNGARVRVITGTPTSGAAKTDAFGVNGTPTPGNSQFPLSVVNMPALDTVVDSTQIDDRRYRTSGKSVIATTESRSNAAYGSLTTPDLVRNLVLPADGLICVMYQAIWKESVDNQARAAIFVGVNQLKARTLGGTAPLVQEASCPGSANSFMPLATYGGGLFGATANIGGTISADVTTGQVVGMLDDSLGYGPPTPGAWGPAYIFAAAGTYDISVQFKAASGTVTAQNRKLWVWTVGF